MTYTKGIISITDNYTWHLYNSEIEVYLNFKSGEDLVKYCNENCVEVLNRNSLHPTLRDKLEI